MSRQISFVPATTGSITTKKVARNASHGKRRISFLPENMPSGMVVEMDAVSAYPPEMVSKYRVPKAHRDNSWCGPNGPRCVTCNRGCSPNFLNENGVCQYCQNGVK